MRFQRVLTAFVLLLGLVVGLTTVSQTAAATTALVSGDECTRQGIIDAIAEAGDGGLVTFDCESPMISFEEWIDIETTVTIDGSNGGNQIVLDADYYDNFFEILDGAHLLLQHLTLQNGFTYLGGAIYNYEGGTLTINQCTFTGNESLLSGGAIVNDGTAVISQSTFIDNGAVGLSFVSGNSGAIDNFGLLTISQSTFVDNFADYAGAINNGGTLDIASSTFSDNYSVYAASTIQVDGPTTIQDSTIVESTAPVSMLWVLDSLTLSGVILAGHNANCTIDDAGLQVIDSFTLANDDSCGLTGEGSHENVTDLGLLPLETATVNGVEQSYFPLAEDSPAINGGSTECAAVDQIGNARPDNFYCDIGAIESGFTTDLLCANEWNGQLSMASDDGCGRSETMINVRSEGSLSLCVNQWNGATRASDQCSRSEYQLTVYGDQTVSICVNRWNSTIRVSDNCSRSENQEWL